MERKHFFSLVVADRLVTEVLEVQDFPGDYGVRIYNIANRKFLIGTWVEGVELL